MVSMLQRPCWANNKQPSQQEVHAKCCLCLQSLVAGVDMEDLGVRSCSTPFKPEPLQQADFPESLKQHVKARSPFLCCVFAGPSVHNVLQS